MTDIMSGIMCVFCCFQILCISCANSVYFSIFPLYFCVMFVSFRMEMSLRYVVFSFLFVKVTSGLLYYTVLSVCVSCHSVVIIVHFLLLLWVYICNMALCCFLARICLLVLCVLFLSRCCACLCILCLRVSCILRLCGLLFLMSGYTFCIYRLVCLCPLLYI